MGELLILYGETITVNLEKKEDWRNRRENERQSEKERREDTNKQVETENSRVSNMIIQLASPLTHMCCNTPSTEEEEEEIRYWRLNVAVR